MRVRLFKPRTDRQDGSTGTNIMNTLIYKRTHTGDPNEEGIFGIHNCMGRVRSWSFDSVIGIGGKSPWSCDKDIAYRITWIGIKPHQTYTPPDYKGPRLEFDLFVLWDSSGPYLETIAPNLYRYMFEDQQVRHVMSRSLPSGMQEEVMTILRLAENHPSIKPVLPQTTPTKCRC